MSQTRILWITERYPPDPGGMAISCGRIVRELRRAGKAVDVAALGEPAEAIALRAQARDGGTDLRVQGASRQGDCAQRLWRWILSENARRPFTAVTGFGVGFPGYLAVTYGAWLGIRSIVLARGNDFDRDWFDARRGPYVRESLSRAAAIGAVSSDMTRRIAALFPEATTRWTPNSVDVSEWEPLDSELARSAETREKLSINGRRVFGAFGELKYKKRIPLWLAAVREDGLMDKVALALVGRIDEATRQIISDPALAPLNDVFSFQSREALAALYGMCDFLLLPSMFDGTPNVLLEAMASGLAPVAAASGGMPDVIRDGETGFLFEPESLEAAAEATRRALALSDDGLKSMGERARDDVAEMFSARRERETLEALLDGSV